MSKCAFVIGYVEPNKYSWVKLISALETQGIFGEDKYELIIYRHQLYQPFDYSSLQKYDMVVFGFSLMTVQMKDFREFMQERYPLIKSKFRKLVSIAGGSHVSARPEEPISLGVDFAVVSEGELLLFQILEGLLNGTLSLANGFDLSDQSFVKSRIYSPTTWVDMNTFPPFSETYRLFGPIEITRGCIYACKYCQTGSMFKRLRHADPDLVYEWLKRLSEIKFDKCWFLSPNALSYGSNTAKTNPEALQYLLSKLKTIKNIKKIYFGTFPSEVRPEYVTRDVLKAVKPYISNNYFVVGAQAVTNELLKKIGRSHTVEDIFSSIDIMAEFNMKAEIDLIFGLPGENETDIQATLDFLNDVEHRYKNVSVRGHTFMPLPGTAFENEPMGIIDPRILSAMGRLSKAKKARGEFFEQANYSL